jgi:hypothetical protein
MYKGLTMLGSVKYSWAISTWAYPFEVYIAFNEFVRYEEPGCDDI